MAVLPAACLIEFLRAEADLVFESLVVRLSRSLAISSGDLRSWGNSFEANVRLNTCPVNCLRLVQ